MNVPFEQDINKNNRFLRSNGKITMNGIKNRLNNMKMRMNSDRRFFIPTCFHSISFASIVNSNRFRITSFASFFFFFKCSSSVCFVLITALIWTYTVCLEKYCSHVCFVSFSMTFIQIVYHLHRCLNATFHYAFHRCNEFQLLCAQRWNSNVCL